MLIMTYYNLFLTQDRRLRLNYNHFISRAWKKKDAYIRKVKLWDVLEGKYQDQKVYLVVTGAKKHILLVEVADGLL